MLSWSMAGAQGEVLGKYSRSIAGRLMGCSIFLYQRNVMVVMRYHVHRCLCDTSTTYNSVFMTLARGVAQSPSLMFSVYA